MGDNGFMRQPPMGMQQVRPKAPNARANIVQQKLIGQSHPTGLTPNLLKLFQPRAPLEHKPPLEKKKCPSYTGMAQYVSNFAEPGDPEYAPPPKEVETPEQKRARIRQARLDKGAKKAAEDLEKWDPSADPNISGDPYKTLFVARFSYSTNERKLKREFEPYGQIKKIRMVTDEVKSKPRGYAFIEYAHTRDMKSAYKQADGKKVEDRRVLVDVERGRTVPNWRPRRLGGGLGSTRVGGDEVNMKYSGREPRQVAAGGPSRSEEPRAREDHDERERGKSREVVRDRERDRERERSHDRTRDREPREERRHRDRDRGDKDRDREHRRDHDRTRGRDYGRDYDRSRDRDTDREHDHGRKRPRELDTDYDREPNRDRRRSRTKEVDYDRVDSKYGRDRHGDRDRDHDVVEHGRDRHDDRDRDHELLEHGRDRHDDRDGPVEHPYELPDPEHDHFERPEYQGRYDHLVPEDER